MFPASRQNIRGSSALPPQFADARYVSEPAAWAYEGFTSPLQTILLSQAA
jgi:hypothetical protein